MSNKFADILSQARNRSNEESEPEVEHGSEQTFATQKAELAAITEAHAPTSPPKAKTKPAKINPPTRQKKALAKAETEEPVTAEVSVHRRPRIGKSSNPDYTQVTAYITKNTHLRVKLALLKEGQGRDVSDIVESQLVAWLGEDE